MPNQEVDVKEIMYLFSSLNISYFKLKTSELELEMKREVDTSQIITEPGTPITISEPKLSEPAEVEEIIIKKEENIHIVTSPIPGTFYRSPAPGESAFVEVGDNVKVGDVLCIIEAMKVMNKIESDVSGEVIEILLEDAVVVEYGTPLIKIRTF